MKELVYFMFPIMVDYATEDPIKAISDYTIKVIRISYQFHTI